MNELIHIVSTLGAASFSWLWMPLLSWSALALVLSGALRLVRGRAHPLLHYRARVVMLLALPLGIALALLVNGSLALLPSPDASPALGVVVAMQDQAAGRLADVIRIVPNDPVASVESARLDAAFWLGLATLLAGLVALWRLYHLAHEALLLRRFRAGLRFVESREIEQRAGMAPGAAGLRDARVRYAVVEDAEVMPMTFGWRRPVVVLPAWLLEKEQDLHMVLLHELVHIRRRDYLGQWIERVVDALFAVHPLVRHLIKQINRYRELACDAEVLARAHFGARAYASMLYQMLLSGGRRAARPALSLAEQPSTLKTRIHTMERQPYTARRWHGARRLSIVLSTTLLLLSTVFVACAELATEVEAQSRFQNKITLTESTVYINGELVAANKFSMTFRPTKIFSFELKPDRLFLFALEEFPGSVVAGVVAGNDLRFALDGTMVHINSTTPILGGEAAPIYVRTDSAQRLSRGVTGGRVETSDFILGTMDRDDFDKIYANAPEETEAAVPLDDPYDFQFYGPATIVLNGRTYEGGGVAMTHLTGYISYYNPAYGRLVFAGVPFNGAEHVARVNDRMIRVETDDVQLTLTTTKTILRNKLTETLWFRHDPDYKPDLSVYPEHMRKGFATGYITSSKHVSYLPKGL